MGTDKTLTFGKTGPYLTADVSMDRDWVGKRLGPDGPSGGRRQDTTQRHGPGRKIRSNGAFVLKAARGDAHTQPVDQFRLMEQMNPNKQTYCCSSKSVRWAKGIKSNV